MSLSKSYQVGCESTDLQMRRLMAKTDASVDWKDALAGTHPERAALREDCVYYSRREYTSKDARAAAKRDGWVRITEMFPLYRGAAEADNSLVAFDLCPMCAPKMLPKPPLPVRTAGEAEATGCRNTEHAHLGVHERGTFCTPEASL